MSRTALSQNEHCSKPDAVLGQWSVQFFLSFWNTSLNFNNNVKSSAIYQCAKDLRKLCILVPDGQRWVKLCVACTKLNAVLGQIKFFLSFSNNTCNNKILTTMQCKAVQYTKTLQCKLGSTENIQSCPGKLKILIVNKDTRWVWKNKR